jgi:hypothetical protein
MANITWASSQPGTGWSPFTLKPDGFMYEVGDNIPKARWVAVNENSGFVVWNKGIVDYVILDLRQSSLMVYSLGDPDAKSRWEARVRKQN